MAHVIYAPSPTPVDLSNNPKIFLAGSIEMGLASPWQEVYCQILNKFKDLVILNPRRPDWDTSWEQSVNDPNFYEQVSWELASIKQADIVAMYYDPATKSAISMMELGLLAAHNPARTLVCCPEGFWRKGNVDILCRTHGVLLYDNEGQFIEAILAVTAGLV